MYTIMDGVPVPTLLVKRIARECDQDTCHGCGYVLKACHAEDYAYYIDGVRISSTQESAYGGNKKEKFGFACLEQANTGRPVKLGDLYCNGTHFTGAEKVEMMGLPQVAIIVSEPPNLETVEESIKEK